MKTGFKIRAAAGAVIFLLPIGTQAADLVHRPLPAPGYQSMILPTDWTGGYFGLNLGYGLGQSTWDPPLAGGTPSPKGFLGGLTAGYNYQTSSWLWGLEADLDYSAMKGSAACGTGTCVLKNSWMGTQRVRVGYAGWNGWLPFLTGGLAEGDVKLTSSAGGASATKFGWAGGLGVEYLMGSKLSLKAEYLYVSLGSVSCDTGCAATAQSASFKANLLRTGINYRF